MKIGVLTLNADNSVDPELGVDPIELARGAEERGFGTFHVGEHTAIPVRRATPYPTANTQEHITSAAIPGGKAPAAALGGDLPDGYYRFRDPFVSLAAIAMATDTIELWTSACLMTEHHPVSLAKTVSTLDHLCGGRFQFGVGQGWNREEMELFGHDPRRALRVLGEGIKAMKEIWTKDQAEFHGEIFDFEPIYQWPKPLQKPHPRVWVGGNGESVLRRVVDYGDGWVPVAFPDPKDLVAKMAELEDLAAAAGREKIPVFVMAANPADFELYAKLGCYGAAPLTPAGPTAVALKEMDALVPAIERFR